MDFHFVKPVARPSSSTSNARKLFWRFLPIFVLAAFLPFLIGLVISPSNLDFSAQADTDLELRVWMEPSEILTSKGRESSVDIYAQFDSDNRLIPELTVTLVPTGNITIDREKFSYNAPFRGKVHLGAVRVSTISSGIAEISIPDDMITVTAYNEPLEVKTGKAKLTIR